MNAQLCLGVQNATNIVAAVCSHAEGSTEVKGGIDAVKRASCLLGVFLRAGARVLVRTADLLWKGTWAVGWLCDAGESARAQVLGTLRCIDSGLEPAGVAGLRGWFMRENNAEKRVSS